VRLAQGDRAEAQQLLRRALCRSPAGRQPLCICCSASTGP
jgi:hypothetical protein